jgi:hypothetical protein
MGWIDLSFRLIKCKEGTKKKAIIIIDRKDIDACARSIKLPTQAQIFSLLVSSCGEA